MKVSQWHVWSPKTWELMIPVICRNPSYSSFEVGWFAWQHAFSVLWKGESADTSTACNVPPKLLQLITSPSEGSHQDKYRQMLNSFLLIQHTILHANRMPKRHFSFEHFWRILHYQRRPQAAPPFWICAEQPICLRASKSNKTLCSSWWGCPTTCIKLCFIIMLSSLTSR